LAKTLSVLLPIQRKRYCRSTATRWCEKRWRDSRRIIGKSSFFANSRGCLTKRLQISLACPQASSLSRARGRLRQILTGPRAETRSQVHGESQLGTHKCEGGSSVTCGFQLRQLLGRFGDWSKVMNQRLSTCLPFGALLLTASRERQ